MAPGGLEGGGLAASGGHGGKFTTTNVCINREKGRATTKRGHITGLKIKFSSSPPNNHSFLSSVEAFREKIH